MKTIRKRFATMAEAESYQNQLCNVYDSVKLVYSPHFEESGIYIWEVK